MCVCVARNDTEASNYEMAFASNKYRITVDYCMSGVPVFSDGYWKDERAGALRTSSLFVFILQDKNKRTLQYTIAKLDTNSLLAQYRFQTQHNIDLDDVQIIDRCEQ